MTRMQFVISLSALIFMGAMTGMPHPAKAFGEGVLGTVATAAVVGTGASLATGAADDDDD